MLRLATIAAGSMIWLGACQAPPVSPEPERCTLPLASDAQRQALWTACTDVLRQHHFQLDRRDRRAGVISTLPVTSQNIVEFWRRDVATRYDFLEASLHAVRRSVEVRIIPATEQHPDQLEVAVYKDRFHMQEREVNNAAGGLRVFDPDVPSTLGQRYDPAQDSYWSPVGRDSSYETYLLQKILDHYNASAVAGLQGALAAPSQQ